MPRRRLSILIATAICLANVWIDYQLLLRNPEEQEAQLQRVLTILLPNYAPQVGRSEVEFLSGKLVLYDVVLHEEGDAERRLIQIPRLEVEGDGFPILTNLSLKAIDPVVELRLDENGLNLNLATEEEAASLLVDVHLQLERGRVRIHNRLPGMKPGEGELLIGDIALDLDLAPDTSFKGRGGFNISALFPVGHNLAAENRRVPGIDDRRSMEIARQFNLDLVRNEDGAVQVGVQGAVEISEAIRSVIPPVFQEKVWSNLGPESGLIEVNARVRADKSGTHLSVSLTPHDAYMVLQGFPVPITEINGGRFEITANIPPEGEPEFLGVTFEGIKARLERPGTDYERGRLSGRGAVYPGRDQEAVTIYVSIDVEELPLSKDLVAAFPEGIKEVYQRFDPQGTLKGAKVQLFKGPYEKDRIIKRDGSYVQGVIQPSDSEEVVLIRDHRGQLIGVHRTEIEEIDQYDVPAISVYVPELGGSLSAMFQDIPVRLHNIHGHFTLAEGPSVDVSGEGDLEVGGTARIQAKVMQGDLIYTDIWGKNVPVGDGKRLVEALPGNSPEIIGPFNLHGGTLDFHTRIEKPSPGAPAQPRIDLTLRGVSFEHPEFPKELTATGKLQVIPWLTEDDELLEIELGIDAEIEGEGMTGVSAKGTLRLPPEQPEEGLEFTSDLHVEADRLETAKIQYGPLGFLKDMGAEGVLTSTTAWIGGPGDVKAKGHGQGATARLSQFPYRVGVEDFDVELRAGQVYLHQVRGDTPGEGRYEVQGRVKITGPAEQQDLDIHVKAKDVKVEPTLVAALPDQVRESLEIIRPEGPISTPDGEELHFLFQPNKRPFVKGALQLHGVMGYLDAFHKDMQTLADEPVKNVTGRVEVEPDEIRLLNMAGTFMDSPAVISGTLDLPEDPTQPAGYDITADLHKLTVDEYARRLAGPLAKEFFENFPADGPVELTFRVHRLAGEDQQVHIDLVAKPRGMTVVPRVLVPVPIVGVTGEVRMEDGEPTLIDIKGFLEPELAGKDPAERCKIYVRRDKSREWRFPQGGDKGRVYYVWIEDLERQGDPKRRAAFERDLPPTWLSTLTAMNPEGRFDVEAWIYQPFDGRAPMRWVADMTLKEVGFNAGIRFDGIRGKVRADGSLSEFEKGSAHGHMSLKTLDWEKQTFRDVDCEFSLEEGVLSLGRAGAPFSCRLYSDGSRGSGVFKGVIDYDWESGRYTGVLSLLDGSLATMMRELDEWKAYRRPKDIPTLKAELETARDASDDALVQRLQQELVDLQEKRKQLLAQISAAREAEEPEKVSRLQDELNVLDGRESGRRTPYQGDLFAALRFAGGGRDLKGMPTPLHGKGSVVLEQANILDVPPLQIIKTVVTAARGQITSSKALENMELKFDLEPDRISVERLRLSGDEMAVLAKGGYIKYNGRLDLRLVPFDTEGIGYEIFSWLPGTGYHFTGTLADYQWRTLPSILSPEWIRRALIPGELDED